MMYRKTQIERNIVLTRSLESIKIFVFILMLSLPAENDNCYITRTNKHCVYCFAVIKEDIPVSSTQSSLLHLNSRGAIKQTITIVNLVMFPASKLSSVRYEMAILNFNPFFYCSRNSFAYVNGCDQIIMAIVNFFDLEMDKIFAKSS